MAKMSNRPIKTQAERDADFERKIANLPAWMQERYRQARQGSQALNTSLIGARRERLEKVVEEDDEK